MAVTHSLSGAGRPRGRCPKALRGQCDQGVVIKISDDSSTDSDMGLDSDLTSSPESLLETDDVIFVDHTFGGCAVEDRGEQGSDMGTAGEGGTGSCRNPSRLGTALSSWLDFILGVALGFVRWIHIHLL